MSGSATTTDETVVGTSCEVVCPRNERMVNSSCNGIGCCQISLPVLRKNLVIEVEQFNPGITNCSYGFVVENGAYIFTESDLLDFNTTANISMRLEWSVGKGNNCSTAKRFLCGVNTQCHDSGDEYFCTCLQGYEGKPTLYGSRGCQDVDECKNSPCVPEAKCWNEVPGFRCECPSGALEMVEKRAMDAIKKELTKLRVEHFRKNGGILLKQQLSSLQGCTAYPSIYSTQELKVATNNYSINNILGSGGNSTVYKGILVDGLKVAVKKSQAVGQIHIEQFINEIVILSQINHRNVVKLLGCCLEA
ncbi:wall-associated receptor kinase 5-like protein [Cinnamomum micranthum f. kanehirae]|uniref:Wall-associated receptor kinase 5-like protein n=1 Tax=Cinnamomum micranthum f. kanehirae TaxID=337451 RepID=A0A443NAH4_9MAGN|nr:wall-associated receptor kinase 5-like protein [Cinnamomum micranthum f. kanehirae]